MNKLDNFLIDNLDSENCTKLENRRMDFEEIRRLVIMKEDMLRLKSRVKWLE